jgi:acetyl-CoA carboxylase biotin carboxyl carrier protein
MDLKEIKKLINLMNENGLTRLEVEEEGKRYLLEKGASQPAVMQSPAFMSGGFPSAFHGAHPPMGNPASGAGLAATAAEDTVTFNSPMVGTFYRAVSPDADALVNPGDRVEAETVLCLIEAMKVFNEIKAEMTGTVVEVLAENGEAVEYNQPLFLIRPS